MKKQSYEINAVTDKGNVRKNNEDNFFVNDFFLSYAQSDSGADYHNETAVPFVAGISDGMGGENFGEEAAFITASSIYKCLRQFKNPLSIDDIRACIEKINRRICNQTPDSGATLAMIYVYDQKITAVSVGDSRIYLYSEGRLKQISKDHTLAQLQVEAGLITSEQAKKSKLRHGLTQFLGIPHNEMIIDPDFYILDRTKADDIILICSDGLTDMVDDSQIEAVLSEKISLERKTEKLIETALKNGGKDNVTVMTVKAR